MTNLATSLVETAGDPMLEAVKAFARSELDDARVTDRAAAIAPRVLDGLRGLGVFGLTLPIEHDGLGAELQQATRVIRELAEHDRSVATTVGLHLGLGTRALVRYGSPELRARLLPSLASGARIAAFATTEPQSGSDLSKLETRIRAEGAELVVTGEKAYVTNGGFAGLLTVTARSDGTGGLERGTAMVVIPTNAKGLVRGPEEHKLGLKGSSTTGFYLDAVRVPRANLLGSTSTGAAQLEHTLSWGRTMLSAGCVGACTTALKLTREHVAVRRQFGRPLDRQPVVRAQLARSTAMLEAMMAMVDVTACQQSDAALHRWSVSAKVFCSERAAELVDMAVQLHGAGGYLEETGVPLLLRDLRVTRIFEGANDVLLTLAGSLELQAPFSGEHVSAAARPIVELVHRRVTRVRDELGVRAFARPELLHQLGRAVVWRDAVVAFGRWAGTPAAERLLLKEACTTLRSIARSRHAVEDIEALLEPAS